MSWQNNKRGEGRKGREEGEKKWRERKGREGKEIVRHASTSVSWRSVRDSISNGTRRIHVTELLPSSVTEAEAGAGDPCRRGTGESATGESATGRERRRDKHSERTRERDTQTEEKKSEKK